MNCLCKIVLWCVLIVLSASACGCNTMRGLGQDIERAGGALKDAFE